MHNRKFYFFNKARNLSVYIHFSLSKNDGSFPLHIYLLLLFFFLCVCVCVDVAALIE